MPNRPLRPGRYIVLGALTLVILLLQVQPVQSGPVILPGSISAYVDGPDVVAAGSTFKVMFTVELTTPVGATIVQVTPVDTDTDQCGIGSVEVLSGLDLGNNQYLLVKGAGIFGPSDLEEEVQMRTLPPYVKITIGYNSRQNTAGVCNAMASVIQTLDPLGAQIPLSKVIDLQLPTLPMVMGHIRSTGTIDTTDQAFVAAPALPLAYTVVSPNPKVELQGIASHYDANDVGDYGAFWFWKAGSTNDPCGKNYFGDDAEAQHITCVAPVPHAKGETVTSTFCYTGFYVDGGVYETWEEPHGETCADLTAIEPVESKLDLAPDVCEIFASPEAQAQFAFAPVAYVMPLSGPFSATVVNVDYAYWEDLCEDLM